MTRVSDRSGQAAVELLALLPLVLIVAIAVAHVLSAGTASVAAERAAQAGATATIIGGDPARSARDALPFWARRGARIVVRGAVVRVEVRPRALVARIAELLTATAQATGTP